MTRPTGVAAAVLLAACIALQFANAASAQTQPANGKSRPVQAYDASQQGAKPSGKSEEAPPIGGDDAGTPRWEPVLIITSVEVMRSAHGRPLDIVRVRGMTSTVGWENPQLVPLTRGIPKDGILDLLFVAAAPGEAMEPTGFSSVDAIFAVEPENPYKGVRVHGATNGVTLKTLPGYIEAKGGGDDCSKCVGKFFVAKGAAIPAGKSAGDVVKETDLPPNVRVIKASDGIGKMETDPNRLTLLLDDDGNIEIAVWD